jgi:hypothetical protein
VCSRNSSANTSYCGRRLIAHYSIFGKIRPWGHRLKGKWQVAALARHRMEEDPGAGACAGQRGQEAGSSGIALFLTTFE